MGKDIEEKQMKLGILITGLGVGGAENHLLKVVPKLKFDKFIISLTNENDIGKEMQKKGVKVYYLGFRKINLIQTILKFRKIIKKEKPDVLDTYLIHANIFGRVFGRLFGVKRIVNSVRNDYSDLKFLNFLDRITRGLVDLYVPNSHSLTAYLHRKNKVPKNKIKVLPNGIDIKAIYKGLDKKYDIRKELRLDKDAFVAVCVSRMLEHKNIGALIEAVRLVDRKIVLVLVGDGAERNHLAYLVEKYGLEKRVFFTGVRMDVPNIVNSSNIFVLPSFKEGMSNALLEAMALKKCCIVSNIPQNKELIKDGANGITFNPRSEKDIAKKINKAYKNKNLSGLGGKSPRIIKEKHDITKIRKKYEKIIKEVLK